MYFWNPQDLRINMTEPVIPFSVPNPDYERFCKMSALLARLPPSNVIFYISDMACFSTLWPMLWMANLTLGPLGKSLAHKRTYIGDKPFNCTKCSKVFCWLNQLKTHEGIHTDEKPFKCPKCGNFFSLSGIDLHEKTHTGEKQFKCTK